MGPRIVGLGAAGEVVRKYVLQIQLDLSAAGTTGSALGYFTSIKGLEDKNLFLGTDPDRQDESTAYFTTFSNARIVRVTTNGPLIIFEAENQVTAYFNPSSRARFSNPQSFKQGTIVATADESLQYILDVSTGSGTGVLNGKQTSAQPFMLNGELVQLGMADDKFTLFLQGKSSLFHGVTRVFGAGVIIQVR